MVVTPASLDLAQAMAETLGTSYPWYAGSGYDLWESLGVGFIGGPPMPAWIIVDGDGVIRYFWSSTFSKDKNLTATGYPEGQVILDEARKCLNL